MPVTAGQSAKVAPDACPRDHTHGDLVRYAELVRLGACSDGDARRDGERECQQ